MQSDGAVLQCRDADRSEARGDAVGKQAQPAADQHRNDRESQVVDEVEAQDLLGGVEPVGFRSAIYDTFAVVTRRAARLTPAARELLAALEVHMRKVAEELDAAR